MMALRVRDHALGGQVIAHVPVVALAIADGDAGLRGGAVVPRLAGFLLDIGIARAAPYT